MRLRQKSCRPEPPPVEAWCRWAPQPSSLYPKTHWSRPENSWWIDTSRLECRAAPREQPAEKCKQCAVAYFCGSPHPGGCEPQRLLAQPHCFKHKSVRASRETGLQRQPVSPEPPHAEAWCRWAPQPSSLYPKTHWFRPENSVWSDISQFTCPAAPVGAYAHPLSS